MPRPPIYENSAAKQAAYRERIKQDANEALKKAVTPSSPATTGNPPRARWKSLRTTATITLESLINDMQAYHDARSENWQESDRAAALLEAIDTLENLVSELEGVEL